MPSQVQHPKEQADIEHRDAIRASVSAFCTGEDRRRARSQRDVLPGFSREKWRQMAELGLTGILIPENLGGSGLGLVDACIVAESLAANAVPEPFAPVSVLAAGAILLSDGPLRQSLLSGIADGTIIPALAWQEQANIFDPAVVETNVEWSAQEGVISGLKRFIPGAGATGFVVSAMSSEGLELFWVSGDTPGVTCTTQLVADGTFQTSVALNRVPVSVRNRLVASASAINALTRAIDHAIVVSAAELVGAARATLDLTLEHLRIRHQFGRPIGSFQALQHRAVDCLIQIELADAVVKEASRSMSAALASQARSSIASRAKARAVEAATLMARESIQMHGAMGFTDECDAGLFAKRILTTSAWLGNMHHHRRRFALSSPVESFRTPSRGNTECADRFRPMPVETDYDELSDDAFRHYLRDFIENKYPEKLRYLPRRARWHEVQDFYKELSKYGMAAPSWPKVSGGMGLSPAKQLIYLDEMERWGVARAPDQGIRQLGQVLINSGSEDQKKEYLPKILSYEHIWAQGYSEPEAGSDLASVKTTAVLDGDEFFINGSKIWTTLAQDATHIYVLCRTDKEAKKQQGISFIITPLNAPGISIRPIRNISGEEEFCEVFFNNVRVPAKNLVGGLNNGWTVAKAVLDFERLSIGSPHRPTIAFNRLTLFARELNLFDDMGFLDDFTRLRLNLLDHTTLYEQFVEMARHGSTLGTKVSLLKVWGMENFQRISEFTLERAGAYGAHVGTVELSGDSTDILAPYYISRVFTIGAGSNEIQRNIIAKSVLNLPS